MIVMALVGGDEKHNEAVYLALVNELGRGQVRRLYLGYLLDPSERVRRLQMEFSNRLPQNVVTIVMGCSSEQEITALRHRGAFICHHYGALSSVYSSHCLIQPADLMISDAKNTPDHVLTSVDAWSECYICHMRRHQRRAKAVA